jgi:hypothetical protein
MEVWTSIYVCFLVKIEMRLFKEIFDGCKKKFLRILLFMSLFDKINLKQMESFLSTGCAYESSGFRTLPAQRAGTARPILISEIAATNDNHNITLTSTDHQNIFFDLVQYGRA